MEKIKFIDLFAGIGGFHLALQQLGAECVFACEWDKHASATYLQNHKLKPHGDITQISEEEIPAHDVLCGGFPCQAFSISGKQKGFEDIRGTLFFDIARIVKHHQPKVLFLENVKNLVRHDSGKTFKTIIHVLQELGYNVHHKIFNTSDFGLPQNRERVYIVGFHNSWKSHNFEFPTPPKTAVGLTAILEENPINAKIIEREDIQIYKEFQHEEIPFQEGDFPNKPIQIGKVNKGGQGERIYHPVGHSITLSAYGGGVGAKTGLYLINGKIRKLSPRECARLQGFPDDFIINASDTQAYKQFGNSVSVNVLKEISKEILKIVHQNRKKE